MIRVRHLVSDADVGQALVNTLVISGLQIVFFFPAPIALALLLNSLMNDTIRCTVQSIVYLPHFIGWVILGAMWQQVLGGDGFLNQLLRHQGSSTVSIMDSPVLFKPLMVLQDIWKETGWGTIIFLAALMAIDVSLYEAAAIDGASAWQRTTSSLMSCGCGDV